jgi:hypothetical protein
MADKRPRWENEVWSTESVPNDIVCKTCMFQMPPVTIDGVVFERYTGSICQIFEKPENKPHEILWEHGDCEYYDKAL